MYDGIVQELIDELGRLPGVGPKSAQRIAFHLIESDLESVNKLADVLREVKQKVRFCEICGNVSENQRCGICVDPKRDLTVICVVEESKDINAIERTREFRGSYHVLGGAISPIQALIRSALLVTVIFAVTFDENGRGIHERLSGSVLTRS